MGVTSSVVFYADIWPDDLSRFTISHYPGPLSEVKATGGRRFQFEVPVPIVPHAGGFFRPRDTVWDKQQREFDKDLLESLKEKITIREVAEETVSVVGQTCCHRVSFVEEA